MSAPFLSALGHLLSCLPSPEQLPTKAQPNQSLNRTRAGTPRLAVISFSASRVLPLRAG